MREENQLRIVKNLLDNYAHEVPFSIYLKKHFGSHPEMGARDRRQIRELCYTYFRPGNSLMTLPFEKRLTVAIFLCNNVSTPLIKYLISNYSDFTETDLLQSIENKFMIVKSYFPEFDREKVFTMSDHLGGNINRNDWSLSFLKKPKVWIRIRKNFLEDVLKELNDIKIPYKTDHDVNTLSFEQNVPLEKTASFENGLFEIQDLSSQRCSDFFLPNENEKWWDACAGSGGKSLLLIEENSSIEIFATDIRESILKNYSLRLRKCGHRLFKTQLLDLKSNPDKSIKDLFDGIIADVPCSGSGTWARTPEKLLEGKDMIGQFPEIQKKVVKNVLPALKPGSPLVYITCSVFKEENEENVDFFINNLPLKLEKSAYIEGFHTGADTLFVARLIKE